VRRAIVHTASGVYLGDVGEPDAGLVSLRNAYQMATTHGGKPMLAPAMGLPSCVSFFVRPDVVIFLDDLDESDRATFDRMIPEAEKLRAQLRAARSGLVLGHNGSMGARVAPKVTP
jgi:hypothetical protein